MRRIRFDLLRAAMIAAGLGLPGLAPRATHADPRGEPRLVLPGSRTVEPGQWITLRWSFADSVTELELLLSTDGGRHYPVCISPQLAPGCCAFRWQVPAAAGRALRLRIRFNRGGREIEGAPSAPLFVARAGADPTQPFGLPTGSGRNPARAPADDRREASCGASEGDDPDALASALERPPVTPPGPPALAAGWRVVPRRARDTGPRFVPMRT